MNFSRGIPVVAALLATTAPGAPGSDSPEGAASPTAAAAGTTERGRETTRRLRELDRFLDHHPLLETELRLGAHLAADPTFQREQRELDDFLRDHAGVIPALEQEPRHLLRRALMREAETPVRFAQLAEFDSLFAANPEIESTLTRNPSAIHDPDFLDTHAALRDFLATHPVLREAFPLHRRKS